MRTFLRPGIPILLLLLAAGGWWLYRSQPAGPGESGSEQRRVAVEAAAVTRGPITDVRTFTGSLEAGEAFTVAPKTGGQVERLHVDLGDRVEKGQVLVELDDDEAEQAVAEVRAALGVARAELNQARADARLAERELARTERLARRDMASESDLDTARAGAEAQKAAVAVAEARVRQREAALARAQVQLDYTDVRADWPGDDPTRLVGERMANAGDTVATNESLLSVIRIAPLKAVIQVPEADYARLEVGQAVRVTTEALPGRSFAGTVARIAPRFAEESRRARVEVRAPNPDHALKPGMFVDVSVTVGVADGATLVPGEAVVRRRETLGVYRLNGATPPTVKFIPVMAGIEGDDMVQILEPADLDGRVVTLGQQMLEDGAPVTVAELPEP